MGAAQSQQPPQNAGAPAGAANQPGQQQQVAPTLRDLQAALPPLATEGAGGVAVVRGNLPRSLLHPDSPAVRDPSEPRLEPQMHLHITKENLMTPQEIKAKSGLNDAFKVPSDVIPTALVGQPLPAGGRVQVMLGSPETREESAQLRSVSESRAACVRQANFTWEGWRYTAVAMALGAPWTIFAPRRWHWAVRWSSPIIMGLAGSYIDRQESMRTCAILHPVPRWAIERATPLDQVVQRAEEARRERAQQHQQEAQEVKRLDEMVKQRGN